MQTALDIAHILLFSGACVAFLLGRFFVAQLGISLRLWGKARTARRTTPRHGPRHDLSHFVPPAQLK